MDYEEKVIVGADEAQIWEQVKLDFEADPDLLEYHALLQQPLYTVKLDIDIDLGGGFESGISTTSYSAVLKDHSTFDFSVHEDDFIDDIGKFFGMQDVKIGFPEVDGHLMIKTNDEVKVKLIFEHPEVREVFSKLADFTFGIRWHKVDNNDEKTCFLELNIENGITDVATLREIYLAFYSVLKSI